MLALLLGTAYDYFFLLFFLLQGMMVHFHMEEEKLDTKPCPISLILQEYSQIDVCLVKLK